MFVLKNSQEEITRQLARGAEKCRSLEIKPRVTLGFVPGQYLVRGSSGHFYTVYFYRDSFGRKIAACDCAGGENGYACYHVAACLPFHVWRVSAARSQN